MSEKEVKCENCNYSKAIKELHPLSNDVFINCPRCGHWKRFLSKTHNSVDIKNSLISVEDMDDHYIVSGGGTGAYKIKNEKEVLYVGSFSLDKFEDFIKKAGKLISEEKDVDVISYTIQEKGQWFEIDFPTGKIQKIVD